MAVIYSTAVKTARMQAVANTVDGGTAGGKLKIRDGANAVLATITLTDPCGAVAGDVLTFDFDPDISTTATATGTAANAIITDSADVTVVSGLTVGTTGTDVILDSTSITINQTVVITAGTITHAA
jgi:hypothetical protein